jgi:small multidrug resistance pump
MASDEDVRGRSRTVAIFEAPIARGCGQEASMMRKSLALFVAIAVEVAATLALKGALESPAWYVVVVTGYALAFVMLAVCLRLGMPVGVTYGVWGAAGVTATALLSALIFREPLTPLMGAGMALIVSGVLVVELGSQRAQAAARAEKRTE